jgi:hypothetical protein
MLTGTNFTKTIIKSLANPGSLLFDTISSVTASCYALPNSAAAAANVTFRWLYDQLVQHSEMKLTKGRPPRVSKESLDRTPQVQMN